jgi:mortality factor 4-like protein 1
MSTPSFSVNERVLCYHGPLIYEAKVLKCEVWDETNTKLDTVGPHYFVHYKGWKQTCVSPNHMATLTLAVYADYTP